MTEALPSFFLSFFPKKDTTMEGLYSDEVPTENELVGALLLQIGENL
jgi:hypothetical protein